MTECGIGSTEMLILGALAGFIVGVSCMLVAGYLLLREMARRLLDD